MLAEKKYFLFDIDGTLAVDDMLYPGSRELIAYIEAAGRAGRIMWRSSRVGGSGRRRASL